MGKELRRAFACLIYVVAFWTFFIGAEVLNQMKGHR